jgi:hypothetical protein
MGDKRTASGPHRSVCDALKNVQRLRRPKSWESEKLMTDLKELEGQDQPGPGDEADVEKPETVAEQARGQDLDVAKLVDELKGEEEGGDLREMVDDRGNAKQGWASTKVLECLTLKHEHHENLIRSRIHSCF